MPVNFTHQGLDPSGALTTHRGLLEDCPAPECQDRVIEQREGWGVYCPHGRRIVERDPDLTDPEGHPVGRLVTPWPCHKDGCTPEAFEREQQDEEDGYPFSLSELLGFELPVPLTAAQQATVANAFCIIQAVEGRHIARAWMIGMNPQLDDQAPILAIQDGHGRDVLTAARAYVQGAAA